MYFFKVLILLDGSYLIYFMLKRNIGCSERDMEVWVWNINVREVWVEVILML